MLQVWLAARRFRGQPVYYTESHSDLRVCEIAGLLPDIIICGKPVRRPLREISMSAGRNPKTAARKDEDTAGSRSASLGSTFLVGITVPVIPRIQTPEQISA
jgi:hypothetical protein